MNYLTEEEQQELDNRIEEICTDDNQENTSYNFRFIREYELNRIDTRSIYGGELETISPAVFSSVI